MVDVKVELFGLARITSGRREVPVAVPRAAHTSDLAVALAAVCPELVGLAVLEDRSGLEASYTFNLNGTTFVGEQQLELKPDDALLLFSSQAGG